MMTKKALYWSVDKNITAKQLVALEESACSWDDHEVYDRCARHEICGVDKHDGAYHYKLARLPSSPWVIYRKGNIGLLDMPLLAIVGPRIPWSFVTTVTNDMCQRLGAYQLCTISGGAQWVDYLAHSASWEYGVPTIVVLWWWFRWYKRRRERDFLLRVVEQGGLVLSERKLDYAPASYTFPQRNRIIAWCAEVVFVPGAACDSWSLITVDFALEFGIPVCTVPWSFYEQTCAGTNAYLCQKKISGITDMDAFLEKYFLKKEQNKSDQISASVMVLSEGERAVLAVLQKQPLSVEALLQQTGCALPELLELLLHLEMKHLVYMPEPGWYASK